MLARFGGLGVCFILRYQPGPLRESRMNSHILLSSLQTHLQHRGVEVERVTPVEMVHAMLDWFRNQRVALAGSDVTDDTLLYRYGGWSEGCATGFKLSLLRRVRTGTGDTRADWIAGMTMMFDPSRFTDVAPFSTLASDWQTLDAFVHAIEGSRGFQLVTEGAQSGAMLEVGGLR